MEREFDSESGPPRLLSRSAIIRLSKLIAPLSGAKVPVFIVACTPLIGLSSLEALQEELAVPKDELAGKPFAHDPESWHANLNSFYSFQEAIAAAQPGPCIFLSGDVHYGFVALADFKRRGTPWSHFVQFTSSALKNGAGFGPEFMGAAQVSAASFRIWMHPPSGLVTTQSKGVPVFVQDLMGVKYDVPDPADYLQRIQFADLSRRSGTVIETSNLGQVIVRADLHAEFLFHRGSRGDPLWMHLQLDGGVDQPGISRIKRHARR